MGTSVERTSNVTDIYKLADAYDMPADKVDGMSPEAVHEAVARAVKRAREGDGPTLLEMKTYRYKGHSMSDLKNTVPRMKWKNTRRETPSIIAKTNWSMNFLLPKMRSNKSTKESGM